MNLSNLEVRSYAIFKDRVLKSKPKLLLSVVLPHLNLQKIKHNFKWLILEKKNSWKQMCRRTLFILAMLILFHFL